MRTLPIAFVTAFAFLGVTGAVNADPIAVMPVTGDLANGITIDVGPLTSAREWMSTTAITTGDTYGAALIGQNTAGAAFLTVTAGRVTTFTFDEAASLHGTLAGTPAGVNVMMSEQVILTGPNTMRVIVSCFTADSSSLWRGGLTLSGAPITQGRLDVGAGAFTNGLLWDNLPDVISSIAITNAVLSDGAVLATSSVLTNGRTLPEMGALVVWNGVMGSVVDESQMIFDITFVPTPGAAGLLAVGGLMAARRRRA